MDSWQKERVHRAKNQDIYCTEVECTDDGFVFIVVGATGEKYIVEMYEDSGCGSIKAALVMIIVGDLSYRANIWYIACA